MHFAGLSPALIAAVEGWNKRRGAWQHLLRRAVDQVADAVDLILDPVLHDMLNILVNSKFDGHQGAAKSFLLSPGFPPYFTRPVARRASASRSAGRYRMAASSVAPEECSR